MFLRVNFTAKFIQSNEASTVKLLGYATTLNIRATN